MTTEELWLPPALRAHMERLTVGTRVRVRLNGECDADNRWTMHWCGCSYIKAAHRGITAAGAIGRIVPDSYAQPAYDPIHTFLVRYETPVTGIWPGCPHLRELTTDVLFSRYAAHELEVLDETPQDAA